MVLVVDAKLTTSFKQNSATDRVISNPFILIIRCAQRVGHYFFTRDSQLTTTVSGAFGPASTIAMIKTRCPSDVGAKVRNPGTAPARKVKSGAAVPVSKPSPLFTGTAISWPSAE